MRIPWTLQRYIFAEMGKTFLLTAVGLTGVFLLGGGVLNMVKIGDVTPGQLVRMLAILLPLAAAFTLPVAALFSAASAYGRISADNEFVACRSSGINIHVLLLPAFVLSLLSAALTFVLFNFAIPGMMQNLNSFLTADVEKMIEQQLARPRGLALRDGTLRLRADRFNMTPDRGENHVGLEDVVFVEVDEESWVRFGTVRRVDFRYDARDEAVTLAGRLSGVSYFDRRTGDFGDLTELDIPRREFPLAVPLQLKFLDLGSLLWYRSHPLEWREVRKEVDLLRFQVGRLAVYDALWERWQADGRLVLSGDEATYTVEARGAGRLEKDGLIELTGVTVAVAHTDGRGADAISAGRAQVEIPDDSADEGPALQIAMYDVTMSDGQREVTKSKDTLGPLSIDQSLLAPVVDAAAEELLYPPAGAATSARVEEQRAKTLFHLEMTLRTIASVLHERLSFSLSICGLIVLAAALGISLRGSHVLVAFGISVVPLLVVIAAIMVGKQLSRGPDRGMEGLLVMWGGIAAVVVVDAWMLVKAVRR